MLNERVAGVDRALQQGGGGALEVGFVIAVQGDAPGGAGGGRPTRRWPGQLCSARMRRSTLVLA
ncbi:hypothetical protein [Streptomyces sp. NPDC015242]|uniref:hypothetical protein n=1 Tax=Streptomyces sp. NPDC015242 TaxID=3364951 RepID=UPI0036FE58A6